MIQSTIILQGHVMPFRYRSQRRLDYFNNVITLLWCYNMYVMTDFVPDPDARFLMGYFLNAVVTLCIIVNLAYLNADVPRSLYNWWDRRAMRKHRAVKKRLRMELHKML